MKKICKVIADYMAVLVLLAGAAGILMSLRKARAAAGDEGKEGAK